MHIVGLISVGIVFAASLWLTGMLLRGYAVRQFRRRFFAGQRRTAAATGQRRPSVFQERTHRSLKKRQVGTARCRIFACFASDESHSLGLPSSDAPNYCCAPGFYGYTLPAAKRCHIKNV